MARPLRRLRSPLCWCVAVTAVALLSFGCSSEDGVADEKTYEEVLADATQLAPAAQQPALEDGEVTFAEYEAAVFEAVDCMKSSGVEVTDGPTLGPGGRYDYDVQGDLDDPERDNEILEAVFGCQNEHLGFIESLHFYREPLSEDEQTEQLAGFVDCASAVTGLEYTDIAQPGEVMQQTFDAGIDTLQLGDCLAEYGFG